MPKQEREFEDALTSARLEIAGQKQEKQKLVRELLSAHKELAAQQKEKTRRATERDIAHKELAFQSGEKIKRAEELAVADKELAYQNAEKGKRAAELVLADIELAFQNLIKVERAAELALAQKQLEEEKEQNAALIEELLVANRELSVQKEDKIKRVAERGIADIELAYQKEEKGKREVELGIADIELAYQDDEKGKRAAELLVANKELAYQNKEKEKRAAELSIANIELAYQNDEKEKRAEELTIANKELASQNQVNKKRAAELVVANEALAFQNEEKEKRAAELYIANKELAYQNKEKEKRAAELSIANVELVYQTGEKEKRAAELAIADIELAFQNKEKNKREIEDRERAQALSYTEGILGTMREPLLVLDKHLRIRSANDAFYEMFSISTGQTEGTLVYELKNARWNTPQLREALEKILAEKSSFNELEIIFDLPGIGSKVMLLNGRRLIQSEQGESLILLAMRDITEQRVLQQRNDSFMSMASHELKTPVTTIKMLVQILQVRYEGSSDQVLTEYLTTIGLQLEQLTNLVVDLLDVSKIKADKFELETKPFDFDALAIETIKSCQMLTPQHLISLIGETNATLTGDRSSISRVFINLITNAIKYSPNADKINVMLSVNEKGIRVGIRDYGIGIAKQHQDKIFDRFFQVGNKRGQSFAGLGIGLYITAAIVKQHKGRIWVDSDKGEGATFFFELPVSSKA